jgi:DNA (cytosine-5)-methyltransferase 1
MGISDEDFYKAKNAGVSNFHLYKQAGNGIVVNVFEAILREMIR